MPDGPDGEGGHVDDAFDDAQLRCAIEHGSGDFIGIAGREVNGDAGIFEGELQETRRQPVIGDGLAGHDVEIAALEAAEIAEGAFGLTDPGEGLAGFLEKHFAITRQFDTPADAIKQPHIMEGFKGLDGGAGG
jgi:hypothetical protein